MRTLELKIYPHSISLRKLDHWTQISDDAVVVKKDWILRFNCPRGEYTLVLEPSSPEIIRVRFDNEEKFWPITTKAVNGSYYKLSGLADWVPEILADVCWFELILGAECSITYWGDRVIHRKDNALE